jgi:hypothetical protein
MWKDDYDHDDKEELGDEDGMEMNLAQRSSLRVTIDQIALGADDDDEPAPHVAQGAGVLLGNANAIRAEEQVVDNTAYYNLVSLWSCLYIRVNEGIALPIIFDPRTQHMVRNKRVQFDF